MYLTGVSCYKNVSGKITFGIIQSRSKGKKNNQILKILKFLEGI